jgi:hypothetical protein
MKRFKAMAQETSNQEQTILPRSPWNDQRAWLKLMIKTKKALDEAEKKSLRADSIIHSHNKTEGNKLG